jgi:cysteine desulfurase
LGHAARLAASELEHRGVHWRGLADRLRAGLVGLGARIHGDAEACTGNTLNVAFAGCPGDLVCMALDLEGIAVSTGAACSSGSVEVSPVLLGLGMPIGRAREAVRFSLGWTTTVAEIDACLERLPPVVERIRSAALEAAQ